MELFSNEIIAQVVSFLLLLFILRTFLWKKFLNLLDSRREKIALDLKQIEDAKSEIEGIKSDYNARLDNIESMAKAKTEEAIAEGRRIAEELRQGAKEDTEKMVENAKAAIADELAKAREQLKGDIVDIAIGAAEKVIEEKLTESSDKKIVEEFLNKLNEV